MDLAALVDLEWLLRDGSDSAGPPPGGADVERERAVARRVAAEHGVEFAAARARADADRGLREALARGWLDAVRGRHVYEQLHVRRRVGPQHADAARAAHGQRGVLLVAPETASSAALSRSASSMTISGSLPPSSSTVRR